MLPQALWLYIVAYHLWATLTSCCYWSAVEDDIKKWMSAFIMTPAQWAYISITALTFPVCAWQTAAQQNNKHIKLRPWLQGFGIIALPSLKMCSKDNDVKERVKKTKSHPQLFVFYMKGNYQTSGHIIAFTHDFSLQWFSSYSLQQVCTSSKILWCLCTETHH